MNIYGDWGNALVLAQRLRWHGYTPELLEYNVGDAFPAGRRPDRRRRRAGQRTARHPG